MTVLRRDRVIPLADLNHYPGSEYLDLTIYLPWSDDTRRRMWPMISESSPVISIDDVTAGPERVAGGRPWWIDCGIARRPLPTEPPWGMGEFYQLPVRGIRHRRKANIITTCT